MMKPIALGVACAITAACGDTQQAEAPAGTAVTEPETPSDTAIDPDGDALVEGTEFNATAQIQCGFDGAEPTQSCEAGVKRNWMEEGRSLVSVTKPDGYTRAIYFEGTTPFGADSAEADGSAGWDFEFSQEGDQITVNFGPETYVVVDALITGG